MSYGCREPSREVGFSAAAGETTYAPPRHAYAGDTADDFRRNQAARTEFSRRVADMEETRFRMLGEEW